MLRFVQNDPACWMPYEIECNHIGPRHDAVFPGPAVFLTVLAACDFGLNGAGAGILLDLGRLRDETRD